VLRVAIVIGHSEVLGYEREPVPSQGLGLNFQRVASFIGTRVQPANGLEDIDHDLLAEKFRAEHVKVSDARHTCGRWLRSAGRIRADFAVGANHACTNHTHDLTDLSDHLEFSLRVY
jgi:hypothetical protein